MQALCQAEVLREAFLTQLDDFLADEKPPPSVQQFAGTLATQAWNRLAEIDGRIQAASENWKVARMAPVDRNVLRIAVCELLTEPNTPYRVVIDEAVEIGKTFGTADSGAFINGVLDTVYKAIVEEQQAAEETSKSQKVETSK